MVCFFVNKKQTVEADSISARTGFVLPFICKEGSRPLPTDLTKMTGKMEMDGHVHAGGYGIRPYGIFVGEFWPRRGQSERSEKA